MAGPAFCSGAQGQINLAGTPVAGLASWTMTKYTTPVQLLHYESFTDDDNNIWEDQLVGASRANVSFEGWIDVNPDTATDSVLYNGAVVTMDFILVKDTPWGFAGVSVQIEQIDISSSIQSDKPATFKGTGKVKGSPGGTEVVTT